MTSESRGPGEGTAQAHNLAQSSVWSAGPETGSVDKQVPSGGWRPAKVLANAFLFSKELQIAQLSDVHPMVWEYRRKGGRDRSSWSTQNRFSVNCTVTVVPSFEVFADVEVYKQWEAIIQCDQSA